MLICLPLKLLFAVVDGESSYVETRPNKVRDREKGVLGKLTYQDQEE